MFILCITSRYSHFNILFSKPCQRQNELLPSIGVRHLSSLLHLFVFRKLFTFLARLATGNVGFWLPSFVFCHLLTFQILIFSKTYQPNELKLSRKHLWKVLSKECTFCYDPLPNMALHRHSCF